MKAGKPSRLIDAQPLERGTDIAVDDELKPVDEQLRVALHAFLIQSSIKPTKAYL